jgi:hypothetical protein
MVDLTLEQRFDFVSKRQTLHQLLEGMARLLGLMSDRKAASSRVMMIIIGNQRRKMHDPGRADFPCVS